MHLTSGLFLLTAKTVMMKLYYTPEGIMANEIDIVNKFNEIARTPQYAMSLGDDSEHGQKIAQVKMWLQTIRHECPSPAKHYKIGIYIRYFNQTKYDNYLTFHKNQYLDTIALCPNWELVDFYIDEGSVAPNMESAPEWCRLLQDAMDGKVDLIITQKVSNVSKKMQEIIFCSRILAAHNPPIGIYFISEDIFTLASYFQNDLRDTCFFPSPDWKLLPDEPDEGNDQ